MSLDEKIKNKLEEKNSTRSEHIYSWKDIRTAIEPKETQTKRRLLELKKSLNEKTQSFFKPTKIFLQDHWNLLIKSAAHNHLRIQECKRKSEIGESCNLSFESYSQLKKYQKRFRLFTYSFSSTLASVLIVILIVQIFSPTINIQGATYTWAQNTWSGGVDEITAATHNSNKTGWTKYFSKDANIAATSELKLSATSASVTQTSDTDFNAGTNSSTIVSGTGSGGNLKLNYSDVAIATGGNIQKVGANFVHSFLSSGILNTPVALQADALVVAGGGGGGNGGGGGGGVAMASNYSLSSGDYAITVGNGGAGSTFCNSSGIDYGYNGENSIFSGLTAFGGGGGGAGAWAGGSGVGGGPGKSGGSSGGTGMLINSAVIPVTQTSGPGYIGYGNVGGNNSGGSAWSSAGGGAGSAGQSTVVAGSAYPANGGAGISSSITGVAVFYGGGGGGARWSDPSPFGYGGSGGGGNGANGDTNSTAGGINTGGGGGGGSAVFCGKPGGSGIVIVKYPAGYNASGTYTSSIINNERKVSFTTLGYNKVIPADTTLTIDVRAGNTPTPDGSWTAWQTGIVNGGDISGLSGNQYVQYRANLSTSDISKTPQLNDITFNYEYYPLNESGTSVIDFTLANESNFVQQDNTKTLFSASSASLEPILDTVNDLTNGLGGSATALNSYSGGGRTPDLAFNEVIAGDTGAAWLSSASPSWVSIDLGRNVMVQRMKIIARQAEGNRFPTGMTLYGSFNNTDFVSIASMNYNGVWDWNTFDFANNVNYRYYKLLCSSSGSEVGIAEIEYFGATAYQTSQAYYLTTAAASQKNTSTWGHIKGINIIQTTPTNTSLKYLVSFDNRITWKYWNGSSWQLTNLGNLETDGMTKAAIEGISQVQWETAGGFIPLRGTLDFAVNLKTTNAAATPSLSSIGVNYELLPPVLISSPYDTSSEANVLSKIIWNENLPTGTDVKFQLRTSPNGNTWTSWMGIDGTDKTYFTAPDGSETLPATLTDSVNDQWIQYKAFLTTNNTSVTPTLSAVSFKYVVNAKPEFNPDFPTTGAGGAAAIQEETGAVKIDFSVRDPDTAGGTVSPNSLTPSYYYSLDNGANYAQITSGLSAGATNPKTVEEVNFSDYSVTWNAAVQLGNNINIANAKIRVVVTDNEPGPNTTQKDSTAFSLNTMIPVLGLIPIKVDASVSPAVVTLDATDVTPLQMKVSTSPTLAGADWEPYNTTKTITLASSPAAVYFQVKNANGFSSMISSATTPEIPASAMMQDTSNLNIVPSEFRLFAAWKVVALPDSGFAAYKIYRSQDQVVWTLVGTITDRLTNYYGDSSIAGDTNYYYKVTANDTNGNVSAYSSIVNGKANGVQDAGEGGGGSLPSTDPVISAASISSITSTSAVVSWDTDTVSNSMVAYIDKTGGDFSGAKVQGVMTMSNNVSGIGKHNLILTNLTPSKTYYLKLQSVDSAGQVGESVQGVDGYSFSTTGGPAITNVGVTVLGENEARIDWTTNKSVPSVVAYSENRAGAVLTEPVVFEDQKKETTHSKVISNLTRGVPYYFTIKAVDDDGGESIADNAGELYSFTTDIDVAEPDIAAVSAPITTTNQAVITWTTNENATSQVKYSKSAGGPYTTLAENTTLQKNHTYIISDLDNTDPKYYYKVVSKDIYDNSATSGEYSFNLAVDASLNHPPLEAITFEDANPSMLTDTAAVISFTTDQIANCFIEYGTSPGSYTYVPVQEKVDTYNKAHSIALTGMLFSTKHYYKVTCKDNLPDAVAISSEEKDFTTLDKMIAQGSISGGDNLPPTISNIKVANIIGEGVTITWDTDEKSNSTVRYGIANISESGAIDSTVNSDIDNYVASHSVVLTGLVPGTKYLYVTSSTDAAGNIAQSSESSFTTASPSSISSIKVESKNLGTATVSWQTDQETTSTVEYGLSTSYGDKKENSAYATEHSINLSNLNQGAIYHYRVKGKDKDGRFFASSDNTFEPKSPAKITDVSIGDINEHNATVLFKTNVPTDANVSYVNIKDGQKTGSQGARELSTDHKIELTNLDQGSTFALTIAVRDEQGTESTLKAPDLTTGQDQAAPKIDNVKTDSALTQSDKVQTIISWKTDEQATTSILYKEGRNGEEKELKITDNLTNNHIGVITIFKSGTVYNFKVKSIDASGNEAISNDFALLTPKRRENIIQIIIGNFTDIFGWAKF